MFAKNGTVRKCTRERDRERKREKRGIMEWYKWRGYLSQGANRGNSRSSWIDVTSFVTRSPFGQLSSHVFSRDVASKEGRNDSRRPELETWRLAISFRFVPLSHLKRFEASSQLVIAVISLTTPTRCPFRGIILPLP